MRKKFPFYSYCHFRGKNCVFDRTFAKKAIKKRQMKNTKVSVLVHTI